MADPRMFTVKQCQPAYSAQSGASIAQSTSTQRDFFNSIGKIGDLSILNGIGGGTVGRGLRTLATVSNTIRTGAGSLPSSIGRTLDSGASWVLQQTGIAPAVVSTLQNFHPAIVNQAVDQAGQIFNKVKSGKFKFSDIPNVLQDVQNLERLGSSIFTPDSSDVQSSVNERCQASPYAIDLLARSPKYKFLFIVQFVPAAGYGTLASGPLDMAFVVKKSTRPNAKFMYEDVNYYNYRSKILTKTEFEEMTMSFHDDNTNHAMQFYDAYTKASIPITNISPDQGDPTLLEQSGMSFENQTEVQNQVFNSITGSTYAATSGVLAGDSKQIFKEIIIYHLFDSGHRMNVWRFLNPKIASFNLDDLDMSIGSEGNELTLSFNYDSVYLDVDVDLATTQKYDIVQAQRGALYPLRYNGPTTKGTSSSGFSLPSAASLIPGVKTLVNEVNQVTSLASAAVSAVDNLASKFSNPLTAFNALV